MWYFLRDKESLQVFGQYEMEPGMGMNLKALAIIGLIVVAVLIIAVAFLIKK